MGDWRIADGILPSPVVRQRISTATCTARDFCPWICPAWSIISAAAVVSLYRFAMFLLAPVSLLRRRVSLFIASRFYNRAVSGCLPPARQHARTGVAGRCCGSVGGADHGKIDNVFSG